MSESGGSGARQPAPECMAPKDAGWAHLFVPRFASAAERSSGRYPITGWPAAGARGSGNSATAAGIVKEVAAPGLRFSIAGNMIGGAEHPSCSHSHCLPH
jgi:hypothetical protein